LALGLECAVQSRCVVNTEVTTTSTAINPDPATATTQERPIRCTIVCLVGPNAGARFVVRDGKQLIGRARSAMLRLRDPAVTRNHAALSVDDGAIELIDLGSANGTRVNGRRVTTHQLTDGDRIEMGGSLLVVMETRTSVSEKLDRFRRRQLLRKAKKLERAHASRELVPPPQPAPTVTAKRPIAMDVVEEPGIGVALVPALISAFAVLAFCTVLWAALIR
jgi:predicted component of type VI protein secretion system